MMLLLPNSVQVHCAEGLCQLDISQTHIRQGPNHQNRLTKHGMIGATCFVTLRVMQRLESGQVCLGKTLGLRWVHALGHFDQLVCCDPCEL
jgi:hypothetical protein